MSNCDDTIVGYIMVNSEATSMTGGTGTSIPGYYIASESVEYTVNNTEEEGDTESGGTTMTGK